MFSWQDLALLQISCRRAMHRANCLLMQPFYVCQAHSFLSFVSDISYKHALMKTVSRSEVSVCCRVNSVNLNAIAFANDQARDSACSTNIPAQAVFLQIHQGASHQHLYSDDSITCHAQWEHLISNILQNILGQVSVECLPRLSQLPLL